MSERLQDKVTVITGAGGGIGRATAVRLISEGAKVVAVDLPGTGLDETIAALESLGGECLGVPADVSNEAAVKGCLDAAAGHFGGIDCLFNNAGIEGVVSSFENYPVEMFDKVLAVNARGVFLGIKHAIGHMRKRGGGAIVNTASVAGLQGTPMLAAYNASKHAVIGLTRAASQGYAKENIRVNAICPSPIETRMMRAIEESSANDAAAAKAQTTLRIPAGRYGEPEEVAALVAFLLSNEASYLFGGIYTIDGGMTPF